MPTFSYEAKDTAGKTLAGIIEALDPSGAAANLREQGLWPTRIEAVGAAARSARSCESGDDRMGAQRRVDAAPFLLAVPIPILAQMYRQFATLMNAGVPISQAMTTLAQQTTNGRLKEILGEVAASVNAGGNLTTVMERHPSTFTTIQIELIRAGETSGLLDVMANRIADYLEKELDVRRKLKRETLYPKIVLFVAGCVILLLGFLKSGSGGFFGMVTFAATVAGAAFGLWWLARYMNQFPAFGAAWDHVKLLIPGPGGVTRRYATARFTRALGTLYGGGVLLPRAVETAARACGNRAIGQRLLDSAPAMNTGGGLTAVLEHSGLLSPMAVQMARTGEQTGRLDTMMDKVADYLESEADAKAHQLAVFAGVGALLLAALVVAYIAISFYTGMIGNVTREGGP